MKTGTTQTPPRPSVFWNPLPGSHLHLSLSFLLWSFLPCDLQGQVSAETLKLDVHKWHFCLIEMSTHRFPSKEACSPPHHIHTSCSSSSHYVVPKQLSRHCRTSNVWEYTGSLSVCYHSGGLCLEGNTFICCISTTFLPPGSLLSYARCSVKWVRERAELRTQKGNTQEEPAMGVEMQECRNTQLVFHRPGYSRGGNEKKLWFLTALKGACSPSRKTN